MSGNALEWWLDQELLLTAEVAARLRVAPATVRRWARDGLIRSIWMPGGRYRRYSAADVEQLLEGSGAGLAPVMVPAAAGERSARAPLVPPRRSPVSPARGDAGRGRRGSDGRVQTAGSPGRPRRVNGSQAEVWRGHAVVDARARGEAL